MPDNIDEMARKVLHTRISISNKLFSYFILIKPQA